MDFRFTEFSEVRPTRVLGSPSGLRLAPKLPIVAPVTIGGTGLKVGYKLRTPPSHEWVPKRAGEASGATGYRKRSRTLGAFHRSR